jgi:hypothetical protein
MCRTSSFPPAGDTAQFSNMVVILSLMKEWRVALGAVDFLPNEFRDAGTRTQRVAKALTTCSAPEPVGDQPRLVASQLGGRTAARGHKQCHRASCAAGWHRLTDIRIDIDAVDWNSHLHSAQDRRAEPAPAAISLEFKRRGARSS